MARETFRRCDARLYRAGWGSCGACGGEHLLRVKGILNLTGEDAPVWDPRVHHVLHPPVLLAAWTDDDRRSRIAFIARDLEPEEVEDGWRRLCTAADEEANRQSIA